METINFPIGKTVINIDGRRGTMNSEIGDDAIESVILAHALSGVDILAWEYIHGIETALQAIDNNS